MTEAEQRRYKSDPYNHRRGLAEGALKVGQLGLVLQLGTVLMVHDAALLEIDGYPLLSLSLSDEGILQLSVSLYNREGDLLAEIDRNEWITGDPLPWDLEFGVRWLTLREREGRISLYVNARRFPTTFRGHLWYNGRRFLINKSGILIDEERARPNFSHLGFVAMRISLDTTNMGLSFGPDERFESGVIVSQPTPAQLLTESMKAWQNLKYPNMILKNRTGS